MKGILVIIDGLGDRPCRQLNNRTPLEVAEKPNLVKIFISFNPEICGSSIIF